MLKGEVQSVDSKQLPIVNADVFIIQSNLLDTTSAVVQRVQMNRSSIERGHFKVTMHRIKSISRSIDQGTT